MNNSNNFEINGGLGLHNRVICDDDFSFSCQAGYGRYSSPKIYVKSVVDILSKHSTFHDYSKFQTFELGFPSDKDELIMEFAESEEKLTNTVYPYVPVELIDQLIEKHGGIKQ